MDEFALLLRGVNVGGVKVLMEDLRGILTRVGFTEVRTVLASGNVVLGAQGADRVEVKRRSEAALREHYGRSIPMVVLDGGEVLDLARPFVIPLPEPAAEHHGYLSLCDSLEDARQLFELARALHPDPEPRLAGRAVCWVVRKNESTSNEVAKLMTAQAKSRLITTRNHNTLVRLAKIIGRPGP